MCIRDRAKGFRVQVNCTVFNDANTENLAAFLTLMTSLDAVSYTHLDVYKRQILACAI